jgi:hypothetical protein
LEKKGNIERSFERKKEEEKKWKLLARGVYLWSMLIGSRLL